MSQPYISFGGGSLGSGGSTIDPGLRFIAYTRPGELEVFDGTASWYPPKNIVISTLEAWVGIAPVGDDIVAELELNGVVVESIVIAAGDFRSVSESVAIAVTTLDKLTVNLTQVGTTTPGSDFYLRLGIS